MEKPLSTFDCQARYDAWQSAKRWSIVGYVSGAALAVTSGILFWTSRPTPPDTTAHAHFQCARPRPASRAGAPSDAWSATTRAASPNSWLLRHAQSRLSTGWRGRPNGRHRRHSGRHRNRQGRIIGGC